MADSNSPVILSGAKTVTTAGTAVALGARNVKAITITANIANTGVIYVGGTDILSTTNEGLQPGDQLYLEAGEGQVINLADLYINSSVDAEGVAYYAIKA